MSTKKYWKTLEHLNSDDAVLRDSENEFTQNLPVDEFLGQSNLDEASTSRRDFLKFLGFSVTAATIAACETPVKKAIPYVVKPEEVNPGIANYYASTYYDGNDFANILVKTREGRPIHIEGNKLSATTQGSLNARVNSSVLSLYDSTRLQGPLAGGEASTWGTVNSEIKSKLEGVKSRGGNIRILTNSIVSPSTKALISEFITTYSSGAVDNEDPDIDLQAANVKHVTYDAVSYSGIRKAYEATHGKAIIPDFRFNKAKTIVSIDADFMNNWLSSVEYTADYAKTRKPDGAWMSKHYQFEAGFTLTGSNADVRGAVKPSEYATVVAALYNEVAKGTGSATVKAGKIDDDNNVNTKIANAAKDLLKSKGASLVICGVNDKNIQTLVNGINNMLENYGSTINLNNPINLNQADDSEVFGLVNEMKSGKVDALIVWGVNPVYSMPASLGFTDAIKKTKLVVSISERNNETAKASTYVCAENNYLESWGDAELKAGSYSLIQPTISPLFDTKQGQECLLAWIGKNTSYDNYVREYWATNITTSWNKSLHDGVYTFTISNDVASIINTEAISSAASAIKTNAGGMELFVYSSVAMGEGQQQRNPWLQEAADPITKVVWDNYIAMNPADMADFNTDIQEQRPADVAKLTVNGQSVELPVVAAPGQKVGTIGVALGYGEQTALFGEEVIGKNAYALTTYADGNIVYSAANVSLEGTGEKYPLATTQRHGTMMGRKMVNEVSLKDYKNQPKEVWNPIITVPDAYGNHKPAVENNLWDDHDIKKGHRWGMAIDLTTCIGCNACVTACFSENNVPVVGRDEVRRNREMHWLRIDRYFSSDADPKPHTRDKNGGAEDGGWQYHDMEVASKYPEVVYQPVMCQHCNHAPCETVCPVAATVHSTEGLNHMAYNRCIGTRYCGNNCPYKVRRFNWFNYTNDSKFTELNPSQDTLSRMVLNPDVVVRERGVMEKCSLCIQRIQSGKLEAKKAGKPVEDGSVTTACSSACPTNAITFGDHNDKSTKVYAEASGDRAYHLIEEVGTQPNIWYQTKVRNAEVEKWSHGVAMSADQGHEEHHEEAH